MAPNRIRELREAKGWTAKDLADRASLWPPQIYEYERGRVTPGYANLRAIADALECSIEELGIQTGEPVAGAK